MAKRHTDNPSMARLCLEEILRHEQISTLQVISAVGKYIPIARAIQAGRAYINRPCYKNVLTGDRRKYTTSRLAELGRREIVSGCILSLVRSGKISRISRGTYGPLISTIHTPECH